MTTYDIPAPMLAKAAASVPDPAKRPMLYEPKWDGFRGLIAWDGETLEIGSRGAKPLTRYFPELVEQLAEILPGPCLLDGEIVVATGPAGAQRLDWEALSQRIHPAASRVAKLAVETPAMFIAFDLLADGDEDLQRIPFRERRARLEGMLSDARHPLHLTRTTEDPDLDRRWLAEFEGAGLDGVVAKPLDDPYAPGKRALIKVKHARSADVVALGYRVHKSGTGVGSLLVGLYGDDGVLRQVGGVAAWTDAMRKQLVDDLAPLVERDAGGAAMT